MTISHRPSAIYSKSWPAYELILSVIDCRWLTYPPMARLVLRAHTRESMRRPQAALAIVSQMLKFSHETSQHKLERCLLHTSACRLSKMQRRQLVVIGIALVWRSLRL